MKRLSIFLIVLSSLLPVTSKAKDGNICVQTATSDESITVSPKSRSKNHILQCIGIKPIIFQPPIKQEKYFQRGKASWYGPRFHEKPTASGEKFNQHAMTAAHPTLPLGTEVFVTNLETGQRIKVEINDRGPYIHGRIIDLSRGAAKALGMIEQGVVRVGISIVPPRIVYPPGRKPTFDTMTEIAQAESN